MDETKFGELFGFEPIYIGNELELMSARDQQPTPTATPTYSDVTTIKMTGGHSRIMPMKPISKEEEELKREEEELEHFLKMAEIFDALESQTTTTTPTTTRPTPDTPDSATQTAYTLTEVAKTHGPDPEFLAYTSKMFGLN